VNNYIDRYGLYNVEPVDQDGLPTGNDGWILTAYAKKLGLPVNSARLEVTWDYLDYPFERIPGKKEPPVSRDVVLGLVSLGILSSRDLAKAKWTFSPFPLPPFNPVKLIKQIRQARGQHRNYFWKNGLDQIYRFAFSVPLTDRAFYYRCRGLKAPLIYRLIEAADKRMKPKNNSSALIRWLKYDKWPVIKVFEEYFGKEHPITNKARVRL
jgi:hypothetical protein